MADRPAEPLGIGWEERRRQQMVSGLEATPAERLAWLEEMIALAHRTGALPRRRDDPGLPSERG